ncbi:MAG: DNA cytosine methyltransferase [Synergistaceae bacterium]
MERGLIIDIFAGGGGASEGMFLGLGIHPDIAINHDPVAIAMHKINHPQTKHYTSDVWEVHPKEATGDKPVDLLWASPDCKHFSKAKGGKPVEKKIRSLAWVVVKWAKIKRPRVIIVENVEEFQDWGPILADGRPDRKRKGQTFQRFVGELERLGYKVEWNELRACDYGAPTIRKRLFLIARCDGERIVWPEPTHGDPEHWDVKNGVLKPYRTAADIIDWSIPCPSIFDRKKPLAENTMKRIARGLQKFVFDNPKPFIVQVNHSGDNFRGHSIDEPLHTVTSKHGHAVVAPYFVPRYGEDGHQHPRTRSVELPLPTIVTTDNGASLVMPYLSTYYGGEGGAERGQVLDEPVRTQTTENRHSMVCAFLAKHYGGVVGTEVDKPAGTVTTVDHHSLVTANLITNTSKHAPSDVNNPLSTLTTGNQQALMTSHMVKLRGKNIGFPTDTPVHTLTSGGTHIGEVRSFLIKYYGQGFGQAIDKPLDNITTKDRFGVVTVHGVEYQIVDIGLRMLQPHELFAAQGFPDDYVINFEYNGKPLPKTAQVRLCGNSVCPPNAKALVEANCQFIIEKDAVCA